MNVTSKTSIFTIFYSGRFWIGLAVSLLIFFGAGFFVRPNLLIMIVAILTGSEVGHLLEPRENAILGALTGFPFGMLIGFSTFTQMDDVKAIGDVGILFIVAVFSGVVNGLFMSMVGYLAGRLLRAYRSGNGFLF